MAYARPSPFSITQAKKRTSIGRIMNSYPDDSERNNRTHKIMLIPRVSDQNGVSPIYVMLEIHHSDRKSSQLFYSAQMARMTMPSSAANLRKLSYGALPRSAAVVVVDVCWLLNVPATCLCISGTDPLRQSYVLPN